MQDSLVDNIRKENYLLEILQLTGDEKYITIAKNLIIFVKDIFRNLEPSHFDGKLIIFYDIKNEITFHNDDKEEFYDKGSLSNEYNSIIFQVFQEDRLPYIWNNIKNKDIDDLLSADNNFIAYVYENQKEYFIVNQTVIEIPNYFGCPSIFALQYHYLNEALLIYKNERVKTVSCEHFRKCWDDDKWIYFKNKPEGCLQVSITEFLKSRLRGIDVVREYNLGASKPVDVRVYWREANRAALIEMKWMGKSLNKEGNLSTPYSNSRANDGMNQIKEYIDLERGDTPSIITKGYLVVIDGRRGKINKNKVDSISRANGMYYSGKKLEIKEDKKYWETYPNIEKPIRMFVEPICKK